MTGSSFTGCTFIPLFPDPWGEASRRRLSSCINPGARRPVACVRPPTPGLAFVTATGELSSVLDRWWREEVPTGSLPVVLMTHVLDLHTWVKGRGGPPPVRKLPERLTDGTT